MRFNLTILAIILAILSVPAFAAGVGATSNTNTGLGVDAGNIGVDTRINTGTALKTNEINRGAREDLHEETHGNVEANTNTNAAAKARLQSRADLGNEPRDPTLDASGGMVARKGSGKVGVNTGAGASVGDSNVNVHQGVTVRGSSPR